MRHAEAVVFAAVLLAGMTLAAASGGSAGGGGLTSLALTSVDPGGKPLTGPSTQAAIAENGRFAVFAATVPGSVSAIYRRDLIGGSTALVSDLADGGATAPDISADGRLISYQQDGDVFVARGSAVHRVTGNSGDPRYARIPACPATLGSGRVTPCGPRLSADGTTLVYPAELTPVPPELSVTATLGDGAGSPLRGDLLDLSGGVSAVVSYTDNAVASVPFSGVAIFEPRGFPAGEPFRLGQTTCDRTLRGGGSCTAEVSFDASTCEAGSSLVAGSLVTHAPIPAGQSVIELTALCQVSEATGSGPPVSRPDCPTPPSGLPLTPAPPAVRDARGSPLSDAGPVEAGRPEVVWTPVDVTEGAAQVFFAAANGEDCGIQLVDPAGMKLADPLPAGAPAPCGQGEQLEAPSSCTAYLLINAAPATPDAAFLGLLCDGSLTPTTYLTVQGVRHIILAKSDPSGAGDFAPAPAKVVSVASDGAELPDATEPSVSEDGRYVGFAAPVPDGASGQQPAAGASEVWLHDNSRHAGTTLVSCLPRPHSGHCLVAPNADSPSLSGSGLRVAFATTAAVVPVNGYPPARLKGPAPSPDRVFVRSVRAATTALVSSNGSASYAPAITQDATAVAFVSVAGGTANLYLGIPRGGSAEIVSATGAGFPSGTRVGVPSLDATGRLTTFPASAALLPAAPAGTTSTYTFSRLPRLSPLPLAVAFGSVLLDSGARHSLITVTDTGPGPATVTSVATTGPFLVSRDTCAGALLLRGSRCSAMVAFTPSAARRDTGELTVTTQDDGEPPIGITVPVTADVPAPRLAISPAVATYGAAIQVTGTGFPPGQSVALTWSRGLGSTETTASGSGALRAALVIFPDDIIGPRSLRSARGALVLARASLLVQKPSVEPPFSAASPP